MKAFNNTLLVIFLTFCLFSCSSKSPCDKFLDGYEKYVEQAIEMAKKLEKNPNDASIIADYAKMQSEALKWAQQPETCKNDPDFLKKFTEIQMRLVNKMQ